MNKFNKMAVVHLAFLSFASEPLLADDARLQQLRDQGFARIAIANEPPFTSVGADGTVSGGAPDVARAVFKQLGVNDVVATITEYGGMIPGLQARRFDAITAGLYMKPERCNAVAYSQPVLCDAEGFLLKKELAGEITTYEAVAKAGLKIGVLSASSEEKYAVAAGVSRDNITIVPDGPSAAKMLQDGRIAVFASSALPIADLASKTNDGTLAKVVPVGGQPVSCDGAAFHKNDVGLRDAFDVELAKLKESGEFAKIVEPYGFSAQAAITATRAELCEGKGPN